MRRETVRVQVTLPGELLDAIDSLVGKRARSRFMIEAAEEKLRRERLGRSLERVAGSLVGQDTPPEWDSSEGAAQWVHALRRSTNCPH